MWSTREEWKLGRRRGLSWRRAERGGGLGGEESANAKTNEGGPWGPP